MSKLTARVVMPCAVCGQPLKTTKVDSMDGRLVHRLCVKAAAETMPPTMVERVAAIRSTNPGVRSTLTAAFERIEQSRRLLQKVIRTPWEPVTPAGLHLQERKRESPGPQP